MSIRYTLRLVENGAEVWKRYTGDREEALRDLAATLADLEIYDWRRLQMANHVTGFDAATLEPGEGAGFSVITIDLTALLWFDIHRTKPKE